MQVGPRTAEGAERRAAFERFTQSRLDRAYRLAGLILRDQSEAEDAVSRHPGSCLTALSPAL